MNNENLEKALLIYCLKDISNLAKVVTQNIKPEQFSTEILQLLYRSLVHTYKKFDCILNEKILKDYIFNSGFMKSNSLPTEAWQNELILLLYDLSRQPIPDVPLDFILHQLRNTYVKQYIHESFIDTEKALKSGNMKEAIKLFQEKAGGLVELSANSPIESIEIGKGMQRLGENYLERKDNPDKFKGLYIGFPTFDAITDGLHPGQVTLLVGAEKSGKSVLGVNIVYNILQKGNKRIASIVTEGGTELPIRRLASRHAGVNPSKARDGKLTEEDQIKYFDAIKFYQNSKAYTIISMSPSACTASSIKKELEKHEESGNFDLIIVDHIGLMNTDDIDSRQKEHTRLERVIIELIDLARVKKVPILAVTHINREGSKRKGTTFNTYDLARSYNMSQHIDTMISWCPKNPDELKRIHSGDIVMSIPTIRDGETAAITLEVDFTRMRVVEKSVEIISYKDPVKAEGVVP